MTEMAVDRSQEDRNQEGKERCHFLINGLDAILWEADPNTLQFSFGSERAEAILGYPVEQWLKEPNFWVDRKFETEGRGRLECKRDLRIISSLYSFNVADHCFRIMNEGLLCEASRVERRQLKNSQSLCQSL